MKESIISDEIEEDSHIIELWEPLEFNIDDEFEYIPKNRIFTLFSDLFFYGIAYPILTVVTKLVYDLKIEGKENLKKVKGGAVSVSNHVLILDCAMVGIAYGFKKIYFTTLEGSFKIPFVRKLIKVLRAIPIPVSINNKKHFINEIDNIIRKNEVVHFYPETSLWPYYNKIRKFKNGPFNFAVRNNVPVIPLVFEFRTPNGLRKIFKRKPDVTLKILEPIYSEKNNLSEKEQAINLKDKVRLKMEEACVIEKNS